MFCPAATSSSIHSRIQREPRRWYSPIDQFYQGFDVLNRSAGRLIASRRGSYTNPFPGGGKFFLEFGDAKSPPTLGRAGGGLGEPSSCLRIRMLAAFSEPARACIGVKVKRSTGVQTIPRPPSFTISSCSRVQRSCAVFSRISRHRAGITGSLGNRYFSAVNSLAESVLFNLRVQATLSERHRGSPIYKQNLSCSITVLLISLNSCGRPRTPDTIRVRLGRLNACVDTRRLS